MGRAGLAVGGQARPGPVDKSEGLGVGLASPKYCEPPRWFATVLSAPCHIEVCARGQQVLHPLTGMLSKFVFVGYSLLKFHTSSWFCVPKGRIDLPHNVSKVLDLCSIMSFQKVLE